MVLYFLVICSIRTNFASRWKIWFDFCGKAKIASFFLLSFRWLFNLRLKVVSLFPIYCIKEILHWGKEVMFWLLHVNRWNIFYVFPVYNFWRRLFFLLVDNKDYHVLCNMGYRKSASFLLSFSLLPCYLKSYCFLLFLWDSYFSCMLLLVSLEMDFLA